MMYDIWYREKERRVKMRKGPQVEKLRIEGIVDDLSVLDDTNLGSL